MCSEGSVTQNTISRACVDSLILLVSGRSRPRWHTACPSVLGGPNGTSGAPKSARLIPLVTRRVHGHDRERHDHQSRRAESLPSSDSIQARPERTKRSQRRSDPGPTTRTDCSGGTGRHRTRFDGGDHIAAAARASAPAWRPVVLLGRGRIADQHRRRARGPALALHHWTRHDSGR